MAGNKVEEEEQIDRCHGNRLKKRKTMTKFQRRVQTVLVVFSIRFDTDSEPNFGKFGRHMGVRGEVKGSAQEQQNERQSTSIDEVGDEIAEKQKIKRNDPVLMRAECDNIKKRHRECDGQLQI